MLINQSFSVGTARLPTACSVPQNSFDLANNIIEHYIYRRLPR
jgi:hypothetical protein